MSFPFETTVGRLAANPGRYEIAYVPADNWLAVGLDTVNDQRDCVTWLSVDAIEPGQLVTVVADGLRFGPFAAGRQIVLRRVEAQS
jgi:hypothetical protein